MLGSIGVITQIPNVYERLRTEGVQFQTVTAGEYKRTLTPFKKVDPKDVQKTEEEIAEIFDLFKGFVTEQRPQLDIDQIATGETWFGKDALERNLADALQVQSLISLQPRALAPASSRSSYGVLTTFDCDWPPPLRSELQTFDDVLLELHGAGVDIYSVTYKKPHDSPLAKLGLGAGAAAPSMAPVGAAPTNWLTRVAAAVFGVPLPQPVPVLATTPSLVERQPHFRDPRWG